MSENVKRSHKSHCIHEYRSFKTLISYTSSIETDGSAYFKARDQGERTQACEVRKHTYCKLGHLKQISLAAI